MWKQLLADLNLAGLHSIASHKNYGIEFLGLQPFISSFPDHPLAKLAAKAGREEIHWLGQPGASEQQISAAEKRLGVVFPESYKAFLRESNGFLVPGTYCCVLLPVELVRRFGDDNPEIVAMWADAHAKEPHLCDDTDITTRMGDAIQLTAEPWDFDWFVMFDPEEMRMKEEPSPVVYCRQDCDCKTSFVALIQNLAASYKPKD